MCGGEGVSGGRLCILVQCGGGLSLSQFCGKGVGAREWVQESGCKEGGAREWVLPKERFLVREDRNISHSVA